MAEGNAHVAIVTGPATFSATLELGRGGRRPRQAAARSCCRCRRPASATATFDVPGEQSDLRVSPGLVFRRTSAAGRTVVEATLDPGTPTTVSWSARETGPTATPRDTRMLADIKTLITIGDADVRLLALVDVTIVQGEPASDRRPPACRLRARRRHRQLAGAQRTASRSRRPVRHAGRRAGGISSC